MNHSILIIGGGNMGGAIAKALHQDEYFSVAVVEVDEARRKAFAVKGIPAHATLAEAAKADCYLLAIKPQQFLDYTVELGAALQGSSPLLISIMAGTPLAALQAVCPRAVRVMPNLPAMVHESMSVLCAPQLDAASRALAEAVFAPIGAVDWVEDEALLHAVTGISGSGPAYFFAFMEALEKVAMAQGLSAELAKKLVVQTARGAALLASKTPSDIAQLRAQVTSKGGTTEAALKQFTTGDLDGLVDRAVAAAILRSRELSGT